MAEQQRVWESDGFLKRQWELRSNDLSSLYPSQAWCMYRTLMNCSSVLDIGFGSPHTAANVMAIKPMRYLGIDSSKAVVSAAKEFESDKIKFERMEFPQSGIVMPGHFLHGPFDAVMGWSLTYAVTDPYNLIREMWYKTGKYLMFDVRAIHGDKDVIDINRAYGEHDGERSIYSILGWDKFCAFLKDDLRPARIEFCSYYYPPSKYVHIAAGIPQPFAAGIVLHSDQSGDRGEPKGNLVPPL